MRKLYLSLGLVVLLCLYTACGSSNGTVTGFIPQGNFSNASLNGQYVYQIEGFDFSSSATGVPYREAGVFIANGSGGITSATDDFSEGSTVLTTTSTGTYAISKDGTGSVSFNNALGTINLAVTMVSASKVYLVEGDQVLNAGGLAEKQDATVIAAAPSGTFVFREHDIDAAQSTGSVGAFTVSGGTVSSGSKDENRAGVLSSLTFTGGSFNAPDPLTGRGSGTLTDSSPATSSFFYYIVDANNVRFLSQDVGVVGSGRAEKQTGTPTLSGSYAFGSEGDTIGFLSSVNSAGRFTASSGTINGGARDTVQDGSSAVNVTFTGTYTQAAGGRASVALSTAANSNLVVWMISPARGFFVVDDPTTVQEGTLDLQQTATFSNSTMNGQYGLVMDGFDAGGAKDRVGTLQWDGSGNLILNEFTNANGVITVPIVLSGSYSVSSNGRATGSISSLSNGLVFYLISGNDAYVLQNDPGVQIDGTLSKQQ
jgi:major membrane immunogen (membrane-anchored lipoprotein)